MASIVVGADLGLFEELLPALQKTTGKDGVAGTPQDERREFGEAVALRPAGCQPRIIGREFVYKGPHRLALAGISKRCHVLGVECGCQMLAIGKDGGDEPARREIVVQVEVCTDPPL